MALDLLSCVWTWRLVAWDFCGVSPLEGPSHALATAIRQLREDRGITQEDLAHDAGITTGTLSKIERCLANPSWTTVERIARALGTNVARLAAAAERLTKS